MLFNSIPFLVFVVLFFGVWCFVKKYNNLRWLWIFLMSCLFYMWWDWRFIFLLLATGSIDYFAGKLILGKPQKAKLWLSISISANLLCLGFFKYGQWIFISLQTFLVHEFSIHLPENISHYSIVLPLGISFYTFNSISYTVDIYRKKAKPAENILHFFAFISFFPHLVAGPIIRAKDVLGQLSKNRPTDAVEILHGLKTIAWGFFQKMVLADNLAVIVNSNFSGINTIHDTATWWLTMVSFSIQIYFDFNGYSTIARGLAKLCGIHFKLNFNHPYFANSFQNFWQRWHISLSTFFRDYVYIPLGGNRKSPMRNVFNRWVTMLLSGLWHGANITFLAWGALHAFYLSIEKAGKQIHLKPTLFFTIIKHSFILMAVVIAWVFFRAVNIHDALTILTNLFSFYHEIPFTKILTSSGLLWVCVAVIFELTSFMKFKNFRLRNPILQAIALAILVSVIILFRGAEQQFIYFQF